MPGYLEPIHPGKIILEEFIKPLHLSIEKLARDIDVSPEDLSKIVEQKGSTTAEMSRRLGKYFGISQDLFANLQAAYDYQLKEYERRNQ